MLETILLIVSVLLIAIVLLQGNKSTDAGGIIMGGNETLFQHQKVGLKINVIRIQSHIHMLTQTGLRQSGALLRLKVLVKIFIQMKRM